VKKNKDTLENWKEDDGSENCFEVEEYVPIKD